MELAQAGGDAPGESVAPRGPGRKINRESKSEFRFWLAGRMVWSWLRLVGMHRVNLWLHGGQAEKHVVKVNMQFGVGLLEPMCLKPAQGSQRPALTGADPSAPGRSSTTGAALLRLQ